MLKTFNVIDPRFNMNAYSLLFAFFVVITHATPNAAKTYGRGGGGLHAMSTLDYEGIASCLFEITDINSDAELSEMELRIAFNRYITPTEQILDGLGIHRFIAQCDTDNSRQVSWKEMIEIPHCLSLAQTEGLAKWLCSRARHGDFTFDRYVEVASSIRDGLLSGQSMKTIQSAFRVMQESQTDARRAAIARSLNAERLSSQVNEILAPLKTGSQVLAIPIAVIIIVVALFVSCLL